VYEPSAERIAGMLSEHDLVLDIGGWARPFNRADYVMDQEPYESRGYYGLPAQGGATERFSRERWIRRDICDHSPYPFADKQIDFVICSHTLEDIRDPLWVCSEMNRIAKAGYIEVPSRLAESCRGIEANQVGWSHHRWLIDIEQDEILFMMKYHKIHSDRRLSFPRRFFRGLAEDQKVQYIFWQDHLHFREVIVHGPDRIHERLLSYVQAVHPRPGWKLAAYDAWYQAHSLGERILRKVRR
jgi:hypothetical protein